MYLYIHLRITSWQRRVTTVHCLLPHALCDVIRKELASNAIINVNKEIRFLIWGKTTRTGTNLAWELLECSLRDLRSSRFSWRSSKGGPPCANLQHLLKVLQQRTCCFQFRALTSITWHLWCHKGSKRIVDTIRRSRDMLGCKVLCRDMENWWKAAWETRTGQNEQVPNSVAVRCWSVWQRRCDVARRDPVAIVNFRKFQFVDCL